MSGLQGVRAVRGAEAKERQLAPHLTGLSTVELQTKHFLIRFLGSALAPNCGNVVSVTIGIVQNRSGVVC